jgi:coenzyme F420-0:L-glutamate ligase
MRVSPIKLPLIKKGDPLLNIIIEKILKMNIKINDGDIFVVSSKVVATSQGRVVPYVNISPSKEAEVLGKKYLIDPRIVELIIKESDEILGGIPRVLLCIKNGILMANAGIDKSNAPPNHVVLLPEKPEEWAEKFRKSIYDLFKVKTGVIISDSRTQPLRLGNVGLALAVSGFEPVIDCRGEKDIYGRTLKITWLAIADNLASAAEILMNKSKRNAVVLIKNAPIILTDRKIRLTDMCIPLRECMYMRIFSNWRKANSY